VKNDVLAKVKRPRDIAWPDAQPGAGICFALRNSFVDTICSALVKYLRARIDAGFLGSVDFFAEPAKAAEIAADMDAGCLHGLDFGRRSS
jgi:hypothetical protein